MGDRIVTWESGQHPRLNMLISYHYCKNDDLQRLVTRVFGELRPRVFLDSGAWSAFTKGVTIKLDDYVAYCHRFKDILWTYCNLDDMTDPAVTLANQREMERQGLSPMPAFHVGEPWKFLDDYAAEYDHVAIGRIVPHTSRPKVIIPYMGKCFRLIDGRAKVHGLGVSNTTLLGLFPFATTDSSAWGAGFRYGRMEMFDPLRGGFRSFNYHHHRTFNKFQELLREHRFDRFNYLQLPDTRWASARKKLGGLQATAYLNMMDWVRKRHGSDYKFFFADTAETSFEYLREAVAAMEGR